MCPSRQAPASKRAAPPSRLSDWAGARAGSRDPWTNAVLRNATTASPTAPVQRLRAISLWRAARSSLAAGPAARLERRSEEHTSELQSRLHLVCRLLLEKKKNPRSAYRIPEV